MKSLCMLCEPQEISDRQSLGQILVGYIPRFQGLKMGFLIGKQAVDCFGRVFGGLKVTLNDLAQ